MYCKIISKLFLFVFILTTVVSTAPAQEDAVPIGSSELINAKLPANASRLTEASIPAEVNQALGKIVASGGGKIRQGETEVLAWTKNYRKSNAPVLIKQLTANLQAAGWTYNFGGENEGVTIFSVFSDVPKKRAVVGFYTFSDDALVWAWTEMLAANSGEQKVSANNSRDADNSNSRVNNSSAKILDVGKNDGYVNLMGSEMPTMPTFPALKPKAGFVRGFVKDWNGKPLQGATIGVRSSYLAGYYSGSQGKTDAKGFYEFAVPKGSAHFYNAGYTMEWGDGLAAVSLHPADGKLDSFVTMDGAVENFVLLPYGMTSLEQVQENPFVPSSYYGGSIYIHYEAFEESDNRPYAGSVPENSIIEITLASDAGQSFVIRKTAGFQSLFRINNIPLGRYQISAKVNGKSLNLKQTGVFDEMFGMTPRETNGAANILLAPAGAKPESVAPQSGGWNPISINIKAQ